MLRSVLSAPFQSPHASLAQITAFLGSVREVYNGTIIYIMPHTVHQHKGIPAAVRGWATAGCTFGNSSSTNGGDSRATLIWDRNYMTVCDGGCSSALQTSASTHGYKGTAVLNMARALASFLCHAGAPAASP